MVGYLRTGNISYYFIEQLNDPDMMSKAKESVKSCDYIVFFGDYSQGEERSIIDQLMNDFENSYEYEGLNKLVYN